MGGFPPGWAEWNDRFRDTVRAFWKGDEGMAAELAARLTASGDKFNRRGRKPWASVNFITAHDGFTLNDLVSYDDKHNEANGEGTATAIRTTFPGTTVPKDRLTTRRSRRCASGKSATSSPPCYSPRERP
ncbi:hypothetical protein [Siccirubricoccus deserti]|uniref:hypothetical protein n=1 Tax=Siccirubricoccus deserti TaxID=2013562 RepID=UPI0036F2C58D